MQQLATGPLHKMHVQHQSPVRYGLSLGDVDITLNDYIGRPLKLEYQGQINCTACGRKTNKSFNQGYCYPCFKSLAQCDRCIMSPELCHFAAGTCREPEWGEANCNVDHIVYLANSSKLKVGITRGTQVPIRWIDQGAVQALPIARVSTRRLSGLVEVMFKEKVADKTSWQAMLKGDPEKLDMQASWQQLREQLAEPMQALQQEHGLQNIAWLDEQDVYEFDFPVLQYPEKVKSFNLDKTPVVEGVLQGIKGQYLIFDTGVINIRKFTAYQVAVYA